MNVVENPTVPNVLGSSSTQASGTKRFLSHSVTQVMGYVTIDVAILKCVWHSFTFIDKRYELPPTVAMENVRNCFELASPISN